jgi:hypothetical protein
MRPNRQSSPATNKTIFSLSAFLPSRLRYRAAATFILLLAAFQFQLHVPAAFGESSSGGKRGDAQQWNVQVDKVDSGNVNLEPSFRDAIYESLLEELEKTKQFKQLFRSGDRNADSVADLLILKTTVQQYTPGSETKRAVTTVSGATKLNVRVQLVTREGNAVLEQVVAGNVRFLGSNLRATHNLAHNAAATLKRSTLPEAPASAPKQEPGKTSGF